MLLIAIPAVRDTLLNDRLSSTVRRLIGITRELRNEAVQNQVDYILCLDLNNNTVWTYSTDTTPGKKAEKKKDAAQLGEGIKIADSYQSGYEKQFDGEATITFSKKGYAQPTVIHLASEDRNITLFIQPFLNAVKIYDRYIDLTAKGKMED
jgi:Tfp pilus assembly protein FimT